MQDIIIGLASISEALKNNKRNQLELFTTQETLEEFKKRKLYHDGFKRAKVNIQGSHQIQDSGKKLFEKNEFKFTRIPSNCYLISSPIETYDVAWLYDKAIISDTFRILCLDQITDVHNAAVIIRTACFYNVNAVMVSQRGQLSFSPTYFRIASGALEYVPIVQVTNLSKTLSKLNSYGIQTVGLSEHSDVELPSMKISEKICAVMGAEDTGISNAVMRVLSGVYSLSSQGEIKSLNVSVASAIVLDRLFSKK